MKRTKASPQPSPKERVKETRFVNKRSELTKEKELAEFCGLDVYRSRMECNCKPTSPSGKTGLNRRDGILIVDGNGQIIEKVIRCKACAGKEKACLVSTPTQKGGLL